MGGRSQYGHSLSKAMPLCHCQWTLSLLRAGSHDAYTDLVLASAHRCLAYDTIPQEHMVKYYEQRAIGSEGGLIVTEGTSVSHRCAP